MSRILILLILFTTTLSCKQKESTPNVDTELNELLGLMQGSFNSEIQSQVDSTYFNISLHMYPIWEAEARHFLYVEQALNTKQDKPYRQRIYEVKRVNDSTFSSAIYKLDVDSLWVGKWKTPKAFDSISLTDISLKAGCEVLLRRDEPNYFVGKTGEKTCESTLYGASYATSQVEIFEDKIISWDRGFDSEGEHIWGAEKGGYIFNKLD